MKPQAIAYSERAYAQLLDFMGKQNDQDRDAACKKYATIAQKFPMLVRTAGLSQAVAFVATRDSPPQQEFLTHILQCIGYDSQEKFFNDSKNNLKLYMLHTRQIQQAAIWYKRFSVSVLGIDEQEQ